MGMNVRRPRFFYGISAAKDFTDSNEFAAVKKFIGRTEPRKAFWNRYAKMVSEGSTVINFYGPGGVGKSALLKVLEDEIKHRDIHLREECTCVKYDFSIGTDMLDFLKTLKFQLSAYGCTFPLFDTGNYYYSLKAKQEITPSEATHEFEQLPWVQKNKTNLSKDVSGAGKTNPDIETAALANSLLLKYMDYRKVLDEDHMAIRDQLNMLRQEKNSAAIYEYLPTLFAQDVTDWMNATGNKLVVFLDNYEALTSATDFQTAEQRKGDSWLRELIVMMPDTLWTIAGRNKLRWNGALADEVEQHLITPLSPADANEFLKKAGIVDENLRADLVKLTDGYPIFLNLCVDFYVEYKRQHNAEPTIDRFKYNLPKVVENFFFDSGSADIDAAKDMIEFLCVLNAWTDEFAEDIGSAALHNFNRNTYERVKNFSFIQSEHIENLTFYRFDKTIQRILINSVDKRLIDEVTAAVYRYFHRNSFKLNRNFSLKLLAKLTLRFDDDRNKSLTCEDEEEI